jgi:hypothetical protein
MGDRCLTSTSNKSASGFLTFSVKQFACSLKTDIAGRQLLFSQLPKQPRRRKMMIRIGTGTPMSQSSNSGIRPAKFLRWESFCFDKFMDDTFGLVALLLAPSMPQPRSGVVLLSKRVFPRIYLT